MRRIMVEPKHTAGNRIQAAQGNDADGGTAGAVAAGVNDGDESKEPLVPVETATVPKEEYDRLKAERDLLFDRLARLQADVREFPETGSPRTHRVSRLCRLQRR